MWPHLIYSDRLVNTGLCFSSVLKRWPKRRSHTFFLIVWVTSVTLMTHRSCRTSVLHVMLTTLQSLQGLLYLNDYCSILGLHCCSSVADNIWGAPGIYHANRSRSRICSWCKIVQGGNFYVTHLLCLLFSFTSTNRQKRYKYTRTACGLHHPARRLSLTTGLKRTRKISLQRLKLYIR